MKPGSVIDGERWGEAHALVVLTDRRLLFVQDAKLSKTTEDFPFSRITSVAWQSGVMYGTIKIMAAGPPPPNVPAGWYSNQDGPGQRYWDGTGWTEHTAP